MGSKDIFYRVIKSFEAMVIIAAYAVQDVFWLVNAVTTFEAYGGEWLAWDVIQFSLCTLPFAIFLGTVDAFRIHRKYKVILLAIIFVSACYAYIHSRFVSNQWASENTCIKSKCLFSAKSGYLNAKAQFCVFVFEALLF